MAKKGTLIGEWVLERPDTNGDNTGGSIIQRYGIRDDGGKLLYVVKNLTIVYGPERKAAGYSGEGRHNYGWNRALPKQDDPAEFATVVEKAGFTRVSWNPAAVKGRKLSRKV